MAMPALPCLARYCVNLGSMVVSVRHRRIGAELDLMSAGDTTISHGLDAGAELLFEPEAALA
jgi:hypothetical protein